MLKKNSGPKKFFPVSEMPLLQGDLEGLDSPQGRPQRREASRATWER